MSADSQTKNKPTKDVMTDERLRKHLFGEPQVPFWNHDPKQLTFGVEVEYFIAHAHPDLSFTLATKAEYLEVMKHLMADFSYQDRKLQDQPGRVSRETERGFIAIKPDFAWHILEISFPPRGDLEELRQLMEKVFNEVDAALAKVGLVRLDRSALPNVPEHMELVELDRLTNFTSAVRQKTADNQFINPKFPACITATHVHMNVFNESTFKYLRPLYEIEKLTFGIYSRPTRFAGVTESNIREKFMQHTMGENYLLKCIPTIIPTNLSDYGNLMNSSDHLFPHDKFFPVRDVTYIRPTKYGTLEFRASCSYLSSLKIIEIVSWRALQLVSATDQNYQSQHMDAILGRNLEILVSGKIVSQKIGSNILEKLATLRTWNAA